MAEAMEYQGLVKVGTYQGYFAALTGGEKQVPTTEEYNGGSLDPIVLVGRPTYTDITVTKNYDPVVDAVPMMFVSAAMNSGTPIPISVQDTDGNLIPIPGAVRTYQGVITGVSFPTVDSGSNAARKMSFTFKPTRVA